MLIRKTYTRRQKGGLEKVLVTDWLLFGLILLYQSMVIYEA